MNRIEENRELELNSMDEEEYDYQLEKIEKTFKSKELTPLEWLNYYKKKLQASGQTIRPNGFDIMETALEDYEKSKKVKSYKKLKEIYSTLKKDRDLYLVFEKQYGKEDCYYKRFSQLSSNNQKSKELKALEIIKKKTSEIDNAKHSNSYDEYLDYWRDFYSNINKKICNKVGILTKEEYDLLKEMLL